MGKLLLFVNVDWPQKGCSERNTKRRCGYSAATTTTATTRNAAQIYCATLGEQELAGD